MEPNQINDFPWSTPPENRTPNQNAKKEKKCSVSFLISILLVAIAATMLLTYTLTASYHRGVYVQKINEQQATINAMRDLLENGGGSEFEKLEFLSALFEYYSYYADSIDKEEVIEAVLRAYAAATGDDYAEYYTEEEYAAMLRDSAGSSEGIGISVVQTEITVDGYQYQVFQVIAVYRNSPADGAGIRIGDYVAALKVDGTYKSVAELGGYTAALNEIRGESGTTVELMIFRASGEEYERVEFSITRAPFVTESVTFELAENDPKVGIVRISEFDMTTPTQFKTAVNSLLGQGVEKFVFDVRNNPGGDLQSIKAVLSYLLDKGDLILSAIDNKGNTVRSYYAEAQTLSGEYAPCSVAEAELGMYRDLNMVVLCNENTASAAEVFTASLRDHKNVPIVGVTTFGKGIMQGFISLSMQSYGLYDGWIKMTTYAYVTECGKTYHDIGIAPTKEVALSDEAKTYNVYLLPQDKDNQLQAAIAQFQP